MGFEIEVANLGSWDHTGHWVGAQAEAELDSSVCFSSFSHRAKRTHSNSSNRFDVDGNDDGIAFEHVYGSHDKLEIRSDTDPLRAGESGSENPDRVCGLDRHHVHVRNRLSLDLGGPDLDNSGNRIQLHRVRNLCPDPSLRCIANFYHIAPVLEYLGVQHSDSVRGVQLDYSYFYFVHRLYVVSLYALLLSPEPSL